ncbi:ankyrin [Colletotrichum somersetense]|nr:ankyrin [Colletotrichum somersetense]
MNAALDGIESPDWIKSLDWIKSPDEIHSPNGIKSMQSKNGLMKIQDAANLAKSHGYGYVWADTCCIDKTSSAELSESINSMYRWYQKAAVCYAYLSDVEPVENEDPFSDNSSFQRSRWFTRGWTLQELIAPKTVEFYARDWSYIGKKNSDSENTLFCELIANITGIHLQVLAGTTAVADISVANKMRWAARRQTTRPEDIAYCMMGLFNVNMPLLYGEGDRSFIRLQEEILKETDDQSLFLWGLSSDDNSDDLFGLLATSPKSFSQVDMKVGHVRPLPPSESHESSPASVTNQGLRTNMLLIPVRPEADEYYAVLDCLVFDSASSGKDMSPRIILRRLWSDQFARVNSTEGSVILLPQEQSDEAGGSYESIYVRQKPFYALPEIRVRSKYPTTAAMKDDGRIPFYIRGAHPPDRWDAALSVIRTKDPQSGRTIAVLRFQSHETGYASVFNMAIGLRRVKGRWEVCHEEHPHAGDSIESVYLKTPHISAASEAASYQASKGLGYITIETTEYQQRGRRFILLEISPRSELNAGRSQGRNNSSQPARSLSPPFDEIAVATRQCCYEETFSDILSPAGKTKDGVRTLFSGNIATCFAGETWDYAVKIERNPPYAALLSAIRARDDRAVQKLVKGNKSILEMERPEFDDFRALHWAATFGSQSTVKTLTKLGVDVTSRTASGFMAVHLAVLNGHFNLAAYMLEEERNLYLKKVGAAPGDPETRWESADVFHKFTTTKLESILHLLSAYIPWGWASQRFRRLIEEIKKDYFSFPHINHRGELPIHRAAATGSMQALEALVSLTNTSRQINDRDRAGRSVLFHAACGGNVEVISKLVSLGAMLDLGDDYGRSPLHAAVMADKPHAVGTLLELGAAADNVTHALGLTPLHFACLYGSTGCLIELIKNRDSGSADVNRWTTGDWAMFQPLHLAVANGYSGAVSQLLEAGCDIESRCDGYLRLTIENVDAGRGWVGRLCKLWEPKTPLELAFHLNHTEIGAELRRFQRETR